MAEHEFCDAAVCVGGNYYPEDSFRAEAKRLGVSRRVPPQQLGTYIVPGQSRVLLIFGATKDSFPKKCRHCGHTPLESPQCQICAHVHHVRHHNLAHIPCYFVPDAIEVVLRLDGTSAEKAAAMAISFGLVQAHLESTDQVLRLRAHVTSESAAQAIAALASSDAGLKPEMVDILGNCALAPGAQVVGVVHEPARDCGDRRAGVYLAASATTSPLIDLPLPATYSGQHFQCLRRLSPDESSALDRHIAGLAHLDLAARPKPKQETETHAACIAS